MISSKHIVCVLLLLLGCINLNAQGVVIYKTDGTSIKIPYTQLNRIDTYDYNDEPTISGAVDGHEFVDLCLPSGTLWATCNLGASAPEKLGDEFEWGHTEKSPYSFNTYDYAGNKWCHGSSEKLTITKYCTDSKYGTVDNRKELLAADDAATAYWGTKWQMPSKAQFEELINHCTFYESRLNEISGYIACSNINGNSMFFPGSVLRYWSRTLYSENPALAYSLYVMIRSNYKMHYTSIATSDRVCSMPVRAVCK